MEEPKSGNKIGTVLINGNKLTAEQKKGRPGVENENVLGVNLEAH